MVRATYNGSELMTDGLVGSMSPNYFFFSPLGIVTYGFIYGVADIWFNVDPSIIYPAVWVPCDCSPACD